ncbi:secondary thiamine-phosphate synthase enzyme YjbQ [candidate division WOR-3 bacterium]|jgi:secondary thiamine-phosphate synthase enzyme|nr:secondary thiamine-phosphate synthase enzyme YjbQ [candidate division WOR-3 bacterium]
MGVVRREEISVSTSSRNEFVDITDKVTSVVRESGVKDGYILLYVPHTTAAVTINENYDPSVKRDILDKLSELVPPNAGYAHTEGNADSHIKSSIIGVTKFIPVMDGSIQLGRWQGIFFCEFDGPRSRRLLVGVIE